ncbi:hypothetical protein GB927_020650 [Shinella sp. CPCC 100929]|uniref:Uncharacterized protein n=1 Tax=Shinella lacus TaxID=2654216 RepID=A0ABT1RBA0_9HYPH|nr:hypothetical protein [Shinella lacus]MCQ4632468.1 hypothetical protein [Shinella lacus]
MKSILLALLVSMSATPFLAGLESHISILEPVETTEIKSWSDASSGDVECRELADIANAFLCLTQTSDLLTRLMARASYFKEASPRGQLISAKNARFTESDQAHYVGHDTVAEFINAFYAKSAEKCAGDPELCVSPLEKELFEKVIKPLHERQVSDFAILAVEARGEGFISNVTHEILHARYYLSPAYRSVVTKFWNENVIPDDRDKIRVFLANTYNFDGPEGEALLINEFQAYTLEEGADKDVSGFARIERTYGVQLREALSRTR